MAQLSNICAVVIRPSSIHPRVLYSIVPLGTGGRGVKRVHRFTNGHGVYILTNIPS